MVQLTMNATEPEADDERAESCERQLPDDPVFPDRDRLEAFVDGEVGDLVGESVAGATVAVVDGDETVLAKGYGVADAGDARRVDGRETVFRIGSVGKLVTWTAVMQAVEDGRIDLDEDVGRYLEDSNVDVPEGDGGPVTMRHLATHTAGFETVPNPGMVRDPDGLGQLETALAGTDPEREFPPGSVVGYSNFGATLAGHVLEEVYDTTFEEYVRSAVFEPLGMDNSTFVQPIPEDHPGHEALPHAARDGAFAPVDPVFVNWSPAGAMSSTAADVARFLRAYLGGGIVDDARILEADTVEAILGVAHERHPAVNGMRFGFAEYGHPDGELVGHSGSTMHFASLAVLDPVRRVGMFASFNSRDDDATPHVVVDAIADEYDLQPEPSVPPAGDDREVRRRAELVAGEYEGTAFPSESEAGIDVPDSLSVHVDDEEHLRTEFGPRGTERWRESSPYVYREVGGDGVLAFDVTDGSVAYGYLNGLVPNAFVPASE